MMASKGAEFLSPDLGFEPRKSDPKETGMATPIFTEHLTHPEASLSDTFRVRSNDCASCRE